MTTAITVPHIRRNRNSGDLIFIMSTASELEVVNEQSGDVNEQRRNRKEEL
jgi:hypothetical protein